MNQLPGIRWNAQHDRDAILAFIAEMGFTPRDAATWDGLSMRAVCAWRGSRLVGVLPVEVRPLRVSLDETILAAHLTCVAVHPDERGTGIGSAMQTLLVNDPPAGTTLLTVYREEPDSPGYRWYLKNGFGPILQIVSWTIDCADALISTPLRIATADPDSNALREQWARAQPIGVVDQRQRALAAWLPKHPYRGRYRFDVIVHQDAYAVIGIGKLHSAADRLDVLDVISPNVASAKAVLSACIRFAQQHRIGTVRVALAANDPIAIIAQELGMTAGWRFDLLTRALDSEMRLDASRWRYASIDFA